LDANAPLEQTDFQGNRPLDYAAEFSSPEIVKILLAKGTKLGATVWQKAANNSAIL
jgi:ankyrin repeat protein